MNGYHVEFFSRENAPDQKDDLPIAAEQKESHETLMASNDSVKLSLEKNLPELQQEHSSEKVATQTGNRKIKPKEKLQPNRKYLKQTEAAVPQKINAEVHPSAAGSLLMGILSAVSFIMLFVIQFNPVWLVVALIIALIVFALLAKKMAKQAFDDMYYARNRYSGKGLAAAGLGLGVISIVALFGLALVILFGIAFISFS
jgi:hypothetical protein